MIYFINQKNEYVKIGYTDTSIKTRMQTLQVGNPTKLSIYTVIEGGLSAEASLHKMFKRHHVRGEWFKFHDDIKRYIGGLDAAKNKARIHKRAKAIAGMSLPEVSEWIASNPIRNG